jgi:hypothetical protein
MEMHCPCDELFTVWVILMVVCAPLIVLELLGWRNKP